MAHCTLDMTWEAAALQAAGAGVRQHGTPITFVDSFNDSSNMMLRWSLWGSSVFVCLFDSTSHCVGSHTGQHTCSRCYLHAVEKATWNPLVLLLEMYMCFGYVLSSRHNAWHSAYFLTHLQDCHTTFHGPRSSSPLTWALLATEKKNTSAQSRATKNHDFLQPSPEWSGNTGLIYAQRHANCWTTRIWLTAATVAGFPSKCIVFSIEFRQRGDVIDAKSVMKKAKLFKMLCSCTAKTPSLTVTNDRLLQLMMEVVRKWVHHFITE